MFFKLSCIHEEKAYKGFGQFCPFSYASVILSIWSVHLFIRHSVCPAIRPSPCCLSVYSSVSMSVRRSIFFVRQCIRTDVKLSLGQSVSPFFDYLWIRPVRLFIYPSDCLFIYPSKCLTIYSSGCPTDRQFISLSIFRPSVLPEDLSVCYLSACSIICLSIQLSIWTIYHFT